MGACSEGSDLPIAVVTKHHANSDSSYDALSSPVMSVLSLCRRNKLHGAS
jgi:hypothetical protein